MTPIEWMALIFALLAGIKILVILIKPGSWGNVTNAVYSKPVVTMIVSLILAGFFLNYLLMELTIVQIAAVMLFLAPLMALGISAYSKDLSKLANKILKDRKIVKKAWLAILVWLIFVVWVLYAIFI
jgi:drug/metabolite transporter (DMT)-like permease